MKYPRIIILMFIYLLSMATFSVAFAQEDNGGGPVAMLDQTSKKMLEALRANRADIQHNPEVVYGIVNRLLLPRVDVNWMARAVLGRSNVWENASPAVREQFKREFIILVEHTYGSALSSYTDERVVFMPLREPLDGSNRVQVESQIIRQGGQPISVTYRMVSNKGRWLIQDFSVDGVSMVQSFRSQFADDLSQGISLEALTKKLHQHNVNPEKSD